MEFPKEGARPVWIASYPRSGNTYLRILLEKVFGMSSYSVHYVEGAQYRDPSAEALQDASKLPWDWKKRLTDSASAPQIAIKTHDLPTDDAHAIFIVRDGRAAIDSYFHYHKKFAFEQPSLTAIIAGACQFGSWSDHYWGWRPKSRPNTLLILYDELVAAPNAVIDKLGKFLNRTPLATELPEFQQLQKKSPEFFRRGRNTDYLKEWTPEQNLLFNELHGGAMQDLDMPLNSEPASAGSMLRELAQTASRLHRLYLEQLVNFTELEASHRREQSVLEEQIRKLASTHDQDLAGFFHQPWIRLGLALRAVHLPPPAGTQPAPKSPVPMERSPVKSSDGNSQSS